MKIKRVIITGGAGFLGSHLCDHFLRAGAEVVCLDDFSTGSPHNLERWSPQDGLTIVRADVSEGIDVGGDVDAVLHFASAASPPAYLSRPLETMRAGSLGTFHALDLARDKGARFVLASTSETYGDPSVHPQSESYWGNVNPIGPRSVYDEAKRFAEALTMAYRRTHGVNTSIVRIFNTFGPRMSGDDGRAIPAFITQALAGKPLTVAGDGMQTRSFCYVDDLVTGIVGMLRSDLAGPVNLGNPQETTILAMAQTIRDLAGSASRIVFVDRPVDDPELRCPDITAARTQLGWAPRTPVEEGLMHTLDWFRAPAASRSRGQGMPAAVPFN
ncbi:UDP-glucuronic acid decarboxylase family protein [Streptomyces sp. NPDC102441]|uniref:UDP-glucuronic acid decarboxylase family protein n=1 Tax=Streptomyces sp. NPDC102441 TaxID=3366176 RepID=UPI0037F45828